MDWCVCYVDIWDIFLVEDGFYFFFGFNVDGKNVWFWMNDWIGLIWVGYRKVVFFVECELFWLFGGYGGFVFEGIEDDLNFIVLIG